MGGNGAGADMAGRHRPVAAGGVRLRRMYVDCRYGQLHLLAAIPPSGGFDERTPLVCLHAEGRSGADFRPLAELLGADRPVYAPDLPGSGASDGPGGAITAALQADAVADLLDELRLRSVDLLGFGFGTGVAGELARARPELVRRIAVTGVMGSPPRQPLLRLAGGAGLTESADVAAVNSAVRAFLDP